mgnify:CR=1 FL=1
MNYILLLFGSAFFMACQSLLTKHTLHKVHAMEFMGTRGIVMLPLLVLLLPFIEWQITFWGLMMTLLLSVVLTGAILYRIKAVRHLEVSTTAPLMNLSPLFLLVIAGVFLQEVPTGVQIAGILLIVMGAYTLQVPNLKNIFAPFRTFLHSKYLHYIIFALLALAFAATTERYMLQEQLTSPFTYVFFIWLFISIFSIALDIYRFGPGEMIRDVKAQGVSFGLVALFSLGSSTLYLLAINQPEALVAIAIPIKRFSTLIVTVVGGRINKEHGLLKKSLGCLVMIAGGVLVII